MATNPKLDSNHLRGYNFEELERFYRVAQLGITRIEGELNTRKKESRAIQYEFVRRVWGITPGRTEVRVKKVSRLKETVTYSVYLITRVKPRFSLSPDVTLEEMYSYEGFTRSYPWFYGHRKLKNPVGDRKYQEHAARVPIQDVEDLEVLGDIDHDLGL